MSRLSLGESSTPLLIVSGDEHSSQKRRQAIRDTWLSGLRSDIQPLFVIGQPGLRTEWRVEGDILRVRTDDSPEAREGKIAKALEYCLTLGSFPFLFLCDDQTWLDADQFNARDFTKPELVVFSGTAPTGCFSATRTGVEKILARHPHESFTNPATTNDNPDTENPLLKTDLSPEDILNQHALTSPPSAAAREIITPPPARPHPPHQPRPSASRPSSNGLIFVQVAAYREKDLLNTLRDLSEKAADPARLRFGLCWQHDAGDSLGEFARDDRVRIVALPWQEARGLCWARLQTQLLYDGEEFVLQIDGHERYVENWDDILVQMFRETDADKPILTCYPHSFIPGDELQPGLPYQIQTSHFRENGGLCFYSAKIPQPDLLNHPVPARFLAGGLFFTWGRHCSEVPYDPVLYFSDEISMAARSYTHGYDLFHPHRHIAWHHYGRKDQPHHWDDHTEESQAEKAARHVWWLRSWRAQMQHEQLFGQVDHGIVIQNGFGSERSLADYESYAGLDFYGRKIHRETLAGFPPPTTPVEKSSDSMIRRIGE